MQGTTTPPEYPLTPGHHHCRLERLAAHGIAAGTADDLHDQLTGIPARGAGLLINHWLRQRPLEPRGTIIGNQYDAVPFRWKTQALASVARTV